MTPTLHDLALAWRRLRHAPVFVIVAVVTLALAIGANTAIFSVADAVLFRPLPYDDPSRVHVLALRDRVSGALSPAVPYVYVQAIDQQQPGVGKVGLRGPTTMMTHSGSGEPEWMETFAVTPEYFHVLGVRAARGRLFDRQDLADPGRSAVLTYESWQARFGGDDGIVGRTVTLGFRDRDIIGVLPRGFVFPSTSLFFLYSLTGKPAFITLAPVRPADADGPRIIMGDAATNPVVRLKAGVTRAQAQAEMDALLAPIRPSRPDGANDAVVLGDPRAVLFPTGRPIMAWLVAAAAIVLLIGSVNLATMLLARTRRREREIGLQLALGAGRARIVWPIFLETVIIGSAAAALAFLVTLAGFDLLLRQVPPAAYGSAPVHVDARVAIFALALGVIGGLLFAILPAWSSANLDVRSLVDARRARTSRRRRFLTHPMISAQVALAIVLVFGALVAGRAFVSVLRAPLGFTAEGVIALNAMPNPDKNRTLRAYYVQVIDALTRRGDTLAAGAGSSVPPDGFRPVEIVKRPGGQSAAGVLYVLPGYFETLGIPLIRGRLITWHDLPGAEVAVISQAASRVLFPDRDPIGGTFSDRAGHQFTVVGVVGDVRRSLDRAMDPPVYVIPQDDSTRGMTLIAKMRGRTAGTLADIRRELAVLAPDTPVVGVWWADSISSLTAYRTPRFQSLVLGTFAMLALGLTALGVFAVVAFAVAARTRELGVRLALGASPRSLVRSTVIRALMPVSIGALLGVLATQWLRKIAVTQLVQLDLTTHASLTIAVTVAVVAAASLAAAYLPARHASKVDPLVVLRAE
jgi:putative ABC transport system permease protein